MGAIWAFLATKMGMVAIGAGTLAAGYVGKKILGPIISKWVGAGVQVALNPKTTDPKQKELIRNLAVAAFALAEYMIPDRGQGVAKMAIVSQWFQKLIPKSQSDAIASMLQEAYETIDDELKKASSK